MLGGKVSMGSVKVAAVRVFSRTLLGVPVEPEVVVIQAVASAARATGSVSGAWLPPLQHIRVLSLLKICSPQAT